MSNTSQYIKFENLELGRDFELNGTSFYKTGKLTAISRTLDNPIEVNPSSMVEMIVTQEVFSKVKELLGHGEGGQHTQRSTTHDSHCNRRRYSKDTTNQHNCHC